MYEKEICFLVFLSPEILKTIALFFVNVLVVQQPLIYIRYLQCYSGDGVLEMFADIL